ncbi:hypothetical protein EZH22_14270 [Xanthobacter dioxanivorans]|uniref:Uncharacterized protein n=1 Tax=Xanthobacter dioxanivorans TaxID=2528964 RepID=A0A974SKY1_9HYPH|nr:hypothetical protein [Xanthobacter dioxanivorans]QRG09310.1 hypothetical protein EZH22_14270 [Xanthobacter dioxanivorans]
MPNPTVPAADPRPAACEGELEAMEKQILAAPIRTLGDAAIHAIKPGIKHPHICPARSRANDEVRARCARLR